MRSATPLLLVLAIVVFGCGQDDDTTAPAGRTDPADTGDRVQVPHVSVREPPPGASVATTQPSRSTDSQPARRSTTSATIDTITPGSTRLPRSTSTRPTQASPTVAPATTTTTRPVVAGGGHDGLEDRPIPDGPEEIGLDLGPLPNPPSRQQLRRPAPVARQWAGLKVLTSGMADGPLWPYSVAHHLPALSDPTGQYVANGELLDVRSSDLEVDGGVATVRVTVEVDSPSSPPTSIDYEIELWRAETGRWLVAFAEDIS